MTGHDIEKLSQNITASEREAIKGINSESLKKRISSVDLKAAAEAMRKMNLTDAANKLDSMSSDDLINQISQNPELLNKLKKLFK